MSSGFWINAVRVKVKGLCVALTQSFQKCPVFCSARNLQGQCFVSNDVVTRGLLPTYLSTRVVLSKHYCHRKLMKFSLNDRVH